MVENPEVDCTPGKASGVASRSPEGAKGLRALETHSSASTKGKDGARTVNAWCEQWRQLGLQAWSVESDSRRETQNPRSLSQEQLEDLRSTFQKNEIDFRTWERELWSGMAKVRKRVHVLARNLHFAPQQGDIRRMVQGAEHDLRLFAEQTQQEEDSLAAIECSLQDTLESSLARFEGWCAQETSVRRPFESPSKSARPPSCSRMRRTTAGTGKEAKIDTMHEELERLDADIAKDGGSTGNWSYEDHDTFLKVFRKFKKKTGVEFIQEVQQLLPHKCHEHLVGHIKFMLLYEDRQIQRKQLVEKWRCMKALAVAKVSSTDPKQELNAMAAREEKRQRASSQERTQKEASERRQSVKEWRSARNEEQRAQREEQQRRVEDAKQSEIRERRRLCEKKHKELESMKSLKEIEAHVGKSNAHTSGCAPNAVPRPASSDDKKRIAERNAAMLQRRVAQVQARRSEEIDIPRFEPAPRASSVGSKAYKYVESRIEESIRHHVDRSREMREDQMTTGQTASKYGAVPGNFAHQGVVRTLRSAPSWRPHFGA